MKKVFIIFLCCIVFCSCRKQEHDDFDLNKFIDEKYDFIPTKTPTPTSVPEFDWEKYQEEYEERTRPKGKLYLNQCGQTFTSCNLIDDDFGEIRIDGGTFGFEKWYDGTYHLNIKLEGQLVKGNSDFYLRYKLYDENNFVVDDDIFKIDGLSEGDKFKNEELIIRDLEKIGTYELVIMNYK